MIKRWRLWKFESGFLRKKTRFLKQSVEKSLKRMKFLHRNYYIYHFRLFCIKNFRPRKTSKSCPLSRRCAPFFTVYGFWGVSYEFCGLCRISKSLLNSVRTTDRGRNCPSKECFWKASLRECVGKLHYAFPNAFPNQRCFPKPFPRTLPKEFPRAFLLAKS